MLAMGKRARQDGPWWVYVVYFTRSGVRGWYVGFTARPSKRKARHLNGEVRWTSGGDDLDFRIVSDPYYDKGDAGTEELRLFCAMAKPEGGAAAEDGPGTGRGACFAFARSWSSWPSQAAACYVALLSHWPQTVPEQRQLLRAASSHWAPLTRQLAGDLLEEDGWERSKAAGLGTVEAAEGWAKARHDERDQEAQEARERKKRRDEQEKEAREQQRRDEEAREQKDEQQREQQREERERHRGREWEQWHRDVEEGRAKELEQRAERKKRKDEEQREAREQRRAKDAEREATREPRKRDQTGRTRTQAQKEWGEERRAELKLEKTKNEQAAKAKKKATSRQLQGLAAFHEWDAEEQRRQQQEFERTDSEEKAAAEEREAAELAAAWQEMGTEGE